MWTYISQLPFFSYLILSIIIWTAILILRKNIKKKMLLLIELFYCITAAVILFYPENTLMGPMPDVSWFQLMPFQTISGCISNGNYVLLMGNLFILMPIPVFLYANKLPEKKIMAVSLLAAVLVEPIQYLINMITRYPNKIIDIDDFILEMAGVCIGMGLVMLYHYCLQAAVAKTLLRK